MREAADPSTFHVKRTGTEQLLSNRTRPRGSVNLGTDPTTGQQAERTLEIIVFLRQSNDVNMGESAYSLLYSTSPENKLAWQSE